MFLPFTPALAIAIAHRAPRQRRSRFRNARADCRAWPVAILTTLFAACSEVQETPRAAAGSSSGGSSAGMGAGDDGGTAGGREPAICTNPEYLGPLANCSPGEPGCFAYGDEWRVAAPPVATDCASFAFFYSCGCYLGAAGTGGIDAGGSGAATQDAGSAEAGTPANNCASGEQCLRVHIPSQFGARPDHYENLCRIVCASDTDCTSGQVCWGGECRPPPACVRDSDCTEDACGHCTRARGMGHLDIAVYDFPVCAYEGFCSESSCAGCIDDGAYTAGPTNPPSRQRPVHLCP
jgi:hypothetical protein